MSHAVAGHLDHEVAVEDESNDADGSELASALSTGNVPRSSSFSESKTRPLPDGGTTKLSPSPLIVEAARRQSKDDSSIRDRDQDRHAYAAPSTPIRAGYASLCGLPLQVPPGTDTPPAARYPQQQMQQQTPQLHPQQQQHPPPQQVAPASPFMKSIPLSPKLDHSHIYASPTNIIPRRSRGIDFSRAATSLHHSTLASQGSPDSSPTIGTRAMNIPGRRHGELSGTEHGSNVPWSLSGNHTGMQMATSLGSNTHAYSDSSSTSDDDDGMDEDMEDTFVMTTQVAKTVGGPLTGAGSPAFNSLTSFHHRQRPRRQSKKKTRALLGLGYGLGVGAGQGGIPRSPPHHMGSKDVLHAQHRRESISWAANQLHISGSESDDNPKQQLESVDSPSRPGVVRRAVTRRGNLLPKTKGFARIRAALAEESTPIETEFRCEAEVIRQVRESDLNLEMRPPAHSATTTALSSPNLNIYERLEEEAPEGADDAIMADPASAALPMSESFKSQALRNSKGRVFWDTFSESSTSGGARTTPPPPSFGLPRGSSVGLSLEDMNMESPSATSSNLSAFPAPITATTASSSGRETPGAQTTSQNGTNNHGINTPVFGQPSAAEITRRINCKRRRDDDFDPASFKRRAVSPGMSVQGSPNMQSPLQRDATPWGYNDKTTASRPGSCGGDMACGGAKSSGAPSETGSAAGGGSGGHRLSASGVTKGRVGYQGMVDTNDGITRLSIE